MKILKLDLKFSMMLLLLLFLFPAVAVSVVNEADLDINVLKAFFKPSHKVNLQVGKNENSDLANKMVEKFSVFDGSHMKSAQRVVEEVLKMPLQDMLDTLSALREDEKHAAFAEFVTRVSLRRRPETATVELPPSHQTIPHWFFPQEALQKNNSLVQGTSNSDDIEHKVSWWREDTSLGEHHCNWHYLYPYTEPPKHRQGELFAYMHQQMLARYDTERVGVGLDKVREFGPGYCWDGPLIEGYNTMLKGMSFRAPNMKIGTITKIGRRVIRTDEVGRNKDRLFYSLARGHMEYPNGTLVKITMDNLGDTIESNLGSINRKLYGNIHNDGHVVIGSINDPTGTFNIETGPLFETATAPRDPSFWRWHKFIDELFEAHRSGQTPYTKNELMDLPGISVESIVVETTEILPGICIKNTVGNLYSYMEEKTYKLPDITKSLDENTKDSLFFVKKKQMNHAAFNINIAVNNAMKKPALATFRVFMAMKENTNLEERRNMFIELDKFVAKVKPGKQVITRADHQSSVVKASQQTVEDLINGVTDPLGHKCGWPLRLVIPRGTVLGLDFELFVIATDWKKDRIKKGSNLEAGISLCGIANEQFPDTKPMGYPFNRAFEELEELEELANMLPNSAMSSFKVKFLENYSSTNHNTSTGESEEEEEEEEGY